MNNKGWIKLYRDIIDWEWWDEPVTLWIFMKCLLLANHEDNKWHGIFIPKGSFITSHPHLASKKAKVSVMMVRTSLNKLKSTGELTVKTTNKWSLVTINNWNKYQDINSQPNRQVTGKQQAINRQLTTNKNDKEVKKETIQEILKSFSDIGKHYKILPEKNLSYWLSFYSVEEIKTAIEFIPLNDFWFDKMDNIILFRRKNPDGEDVDHIGKLLSTPKPTGRKGETLDDYRNRFFKWQELQNKKTK